MPPKKSNQQFLLDAQAIHGNDYKYLSEYNGATKLVHIEHNACGRQFYMSPDKHVNAKQRCSHCFAPRKKTNSEFLQEANTIHNNRYEYLTNWDGWEGKIKMRCKFCYYEFSQQGGSHLQGVGCPQCGGRMKKTTEEFIESAKDRRDDCEDYDFSLVDYQSSGTHVILIHKPCGKTIKQTPDNFLQGYGCKRCSLGKTHSEEAIQWLESLVPTYGYIQHAENEGEFWVKSIGPVDGYSDYHHIVFEYHGAEFHGCPCKWIDINDLNCYKKKYSELFQKTKDKKRKLEEAGYEYICKWSCGHEPNLD